MSTFIFQEELMDHYKFPRYKRKLTDPTFIQEDKNPSCGDRLCIEGKVVNNVLADVGFEGAGCILSQATASLLLEQCKGKTLAEVRSMSREDILTLVGMTLGPTRVKCAMLCLDVLLQGIEKVSK